MSASKAKRANKVTRTEPVVTRGVTKTQSEQKEAEAAVPPAAKDTGAAEAKVQDDQDVAKGGGIMERPLGGGKTFHHRIASK